MTEADEKASGHTEGTVLRVVGENLAYVAVANGSDRYSLAFGPAVFDGARGQSLSERNVTEGAVLDVWWDRPTRTVTRAVLRQAAAPGPIESGVPGTTGGARARGFFGIGSQKKAEPIGEIDAPRAMAVSNGAEQHELQPDTEAAASVRVTRALPPATRTFGKLVDCSALRPGDLMLTRYLAPDWAGKLIIDVQTQGGYAPIDSRWSHAAMYLGDRTHVVEATFDTPLSGGDVRITSLDDYCQGETALRFRRSRYVTSDIDGWGLCIRALSRLKSPYNFKKAIDMWYRVVMRKTGFYDEKEAFSVSKAVICSTLYADSFNEAMRRSLGEVNGTCTPAWLSATDEFADIRTHWVSF